MVRISIRKWDFEYNNQPIASEYIVRTKYSVESYDTSSYTKEEAIKKYVEQHSINEPVEVWDENQECFL